MEKFHLQWKYCDSLQFKIFSSEKEAREYSSAISTLHKISCISVIKCEEPDECHCEDNFIRIEVEKKILKDLEGHLKLLETVYEPGACLDKLLELIKNNGKKR